MKGPITHITSLSSGALITGLSVLLATSTASAATPLQQQTQGGIAASASNDEEAGSLFWNPATITGIAGTRLHVDTAFSWRYGSFERAGNTASGEPSTMLAFDAQPNIAVTRRLSDTGLTVGLGVGRNYMDRTHWLDAESGDQRWQTIFSGMRTWTISPTVAYNLFDKLSLGANVQLTRVVAYGYRALDYGAIYASQTGTMEDIPTEHPGNEGRYHHEFRGNAGALGVGATFSPTPNTMVGFSFTSMAEVNINGEVSTFTPRNNRISDYFSDTEEAKAILNFNLPRRFQLSGQHTLAGGTTLTAGADYVQWSLLDTISIDVTPEELGGIDEPDQSVNTEFKDVIAARVGLMHPMAGDKKLLLEAGYGSSPVGDEHASPAWFYGADVSLAAGVALPLKKTHQLTLQYTQRVMLPYEQEVSAYSPSASGSYSKFEGFLTVGIDFDFQPSPLDVPKEVPEASFGAQNP